MQKENDYPMDYDYIVAIGVSTGGPKALSTVITELKKELKATFVIVQHMPPGFTKSLADRLNQLSELQVKEASHGDILQRGHVYIAPGGRQFKIVNNYKHEVQLTDEPAYKGHRPSVNIMYNALANLQTKKKIITVIMTGMGSDGLEGVKQLKAYPATQVIAQNEATCVVYGMPKVVVNAGLADYVVPLQDIVKTIEKIMGE